ncbi:hypothetical protein SASPL_141870 [Salvia splendens]|uniref:OCEL domain-containing protein n=1 Tax=Salvia splendens TaxID=180675 RepID=A0A8X8WKV9_SALSN|nr:hypothetical protein SASPL_141870 [Salvia splendens]
MADDISRLWEGWLVSFGYGHALNDVSIVLDHQNPAMKNQMKAFAASESTQWRSFKNRKEPPFKKPKSEPTSGGPPKSVFKPGLPKGRLSSRSPLSSQPEQRGPSTSPIGIGDFGKGQTVVSDFAATQNLNKVLSSEKDTANRRNSTISDRSKLNVEAKPTDLKSRITSLLLEHQSTGMSLKALERAIGDPMPNSARRIEPILKQIAIYQAPGRYFLNAGVEMESSKKLPQSRSKQASDEDLDIMNSDDENESEHKLQDPDNDPIDIGNSDIQDPFGEIEIEIEKDSPECDHGLQMPLANNILAGKEDEERRVSERKGYEESGSMVNDGFKHGQSDTQGRSSKGKSKRRSDDNNLEDRGHSKKKSKIKNSSEPVSGTINSLFGESPYNSFSPDRPLQGIDTQPVDLMEDRTYKNDRHYFDQQTGPNYQPISHRPVSDSQPAQKSSEGRGWTEAPSGEKRAGKRPGLLNEQQQLQFSTGVGDKHAPIIEPNIRKSEMTGKVKETGPGFNSHRGYSPKIDIPSTADRSPMMNGRNGVLRREQSDLELGEFREPSHEEAPASKKQFERKNSFKHLENKRKDAEYWNSDFSGGKTSDKIPADPGKMSSPNPDAVISSNPDGPYRRKAQENYVDDRTRPHHRSTQPLDAHHQPQVDINSQQNTAPEVSGKTRFAEAGMSRGASIEAYGDASRKIPGNSIEQQHDPIQGVEPRATKQSKKQKSNRPTVSNDRRTDALTGSNDSQQQKKFSSSDDTSCSFTKFEKEQPELKGPIRDISQYKEYVKEYQEKYESYCSLNKILESYRDEFSKLGKDLEAYKGRDVKKYNDILEQMRSSFRQCGEKHKRLKKIFVVLYEELKHLKQMIKDYATSYKKD